MSIKNALAERGVDVPADCDELAAIVGVVDALIVNRDKLLAALSRMSIHWPYPGEEATEDGKAVLADAYDILAGGDHPWTLPTKTTGYLVACSMCRDSWCWACSDHLADCAHRECDEDLL